ncbi:MAG: helix-turn-helix transcriptional regulator [Planctomycetes bacterium]|nr:helix-turn-helix transcriptional regulator [Planctomycetota bacterium]
MRYLLTSEADASVRQFTGDQYGIVIVDDTAWLVNFMTGEKITLAEADAEELATIDDVIDGAALSNREQQVLGMLGDALNTHEMASRLNLSEKTIETYRARIKQKLGIKDGLKLMRYAVEWRLKHPDIVQEPRPTASGGETVVE